MASYTLRQGDCLDLLKSIPDETVDLVLTDPPYNIGVTTSNHGKKVLNTWDKIDNYNTWCLEWLKECQRVLKPTGVLYLWHNDMRQIPQLVVDITTNTDFALQSFCIWDKGNGYRAQSWQNRDPEGKTAPRRWFNICEYCLHFFKDPDAANARWKKAGENRIYSNPQCFAELKDWYAAELERLGLTEQAIAQAYTAATGRKPHMLRHYFKDNQFAIPTQEVWEKVYVPLGFDAPYNGLKKSYDDLRASYTNLKKVYSEMRNVHHCDPMHCNIWHHPPVPTNKRLHTCQKPVDLLERMIRVSSNPGAVVLDPFMGSASTGVAALNMGRSFYGIEKDPDCFESAWNRMEIAARDLAAAV